MKGGGITYAAVGEERSAATKPKRSWSGWRGTVAIGCASAAVVLLTNLIVLIWAASSLPKEGGIATVYSGSCATAKTISSWTHLLINILSTVLLAASHAGMQVLTAPTREEVDYAHARRRWVDVGVHTIRNLVHIGPGRILLWAVLGLSSIPLHLLYNSVLIETSSGSEYATILVGADFLSGARFNETAVNTDCLWYDGAQVNTTTLETVEWMQHNTDDLVRLENEACISAFGSGVQSDYYSVLLVTASGSNDSLLNVQYTTAGNYLEYLGAGAPDTWLCETVQYPYPPFCDLTSMRANAGNWTQPARPGTTAACSLLDPTTDVRVEYCLARPATQACQIDLSLALLAVVVVCNALKVIALAVAAHRLHFQPLVTVGDAIASFLDRPDPHTDGRCLLTRTDTRPWATTAARAQKLADDKAEIVHVEAISHQEFNLLVYDDIPMPDDFAYRPATAKDTISRLWRVCSQKVKPLVRKLVRTSHDRNAAPREWESRRRSGFSAASPTRWLVCSALLIFVWSISVWLLALGLSTLYGDGYPTGPTELVKLGLGKPILGEQVDLPTSEEYNNGLLTNILVANAPQLLISLLYLLYNDLFTRMHLSLEWLAYGRRRAALRVTDPKGSQRSTRYITLPLLLSAILMESMTLLHWLVSQSIFLTRIRFFSNWADGAPQDEGVQMSALSWSPYALVLAVVVGGLMIIGLWIYAACVRFPGIMPIAGSCSLAISAACHPLEEDEGKAATLPVQWGVVSSDEEGVGHATFSSGEVEELVPGRSYA